MAPQGAPKAPAGVAPPDAPEAPAGADSDPGDRLPGRALAPILGWGALIRDILPPHPGPGLIPPSVIPSPPLLDGLQTEEEWARMLLATYAGAMHAQGRETSKLGRELRRIAPSTTQHAALVEGARELYDRKLAPAAWAAWSVERWYSKDHPAGSGASPGPLWTFRASRIVQWRGLFRAEMHAFGGGRILFPPLLRALILRHAAMLRDVVHCNRTERALREIVARYFPGNSWALAIDAARAECRTTQATLDAQAASDVWLWS